MKGTELGFKAAPPCPPQPISPTRFPGIAASRAINGWCWSWRPPAGFSTFTKARFSTSRASDCSVNWFRSPRKRRPRRSPNTATSFSASFCVGGALGGVLFGILADRCGRRPILMATILIYSVFSGLTYFADSLWQVAVLRFLVALGTGGEWSVAAALVAETFPARARRASRLHLSCVEHSRHLARGNCRILGRRRLRFCLPAGCAPALLVLAARTAIKEHMRLPAISGNGSEGAGASLSTVASSRFRGLGELWTNRTCRRRAFLGLLFATIGLATFWSVTVAGQDLTGALLLATASSQTRPTTRPSSLMGSCKRPEAGSDCWLSGRCRSAGAVAARLSSCSLALWRLSRSPATRRTSTGRCWRCCRSTASSRWASTRASPSICRSCSPRACATAAGLCFNGGRLISAPMLVFSGWLKAQPGIGLHLAVTLLSLLFVVGIGLVWLLPETKDQPLPE